MLSAIMRMSSDSCRMSRGTFPSCSLLSLLLLLVVAASSATLTTLSSTSSSAQTGEMGEDGSNNNLQHLRLLVPSISANQGNYHNDIATSMNPPVAASLLPGGKSRKVREITRVIDPIDDEGVVGAPKFKGLYPSLSGSGELFRLFRPLALSPEKTIGLTRWYLPGFGYFNRGGRAASSNFIRFGRSGPSFLEEEDGIGGGGDAAMLSKNSAKKKNNFIRLGRENPRTTNFIRLGRSGPPAAPGEFFNPGYIMPANLDDGSHHEVN